MSMTKTEKLEALADLLINFATDEDEPFEEMGGMDIVEDVCRIVFDGRRSGFASLSEYPERFARGVATGRL